MNKVEVNRLLKNRIGYTKNEEIDNLREVYKSILEVNEIDEKDFYWSVIDWFFDGNAPFYDSWLKENWRDK